ncbi:MAG: hypothetical protein H7Y20_05955 [Bryobacteraceae bacterium]|nr:hypothetical protein [Bryobacteraceae bacterium]
MKDADMICDFCSAQSPAWRYPALTFLAYCTSNIGGESVGDWASCDACHHLIEAEDRKGLAQRSLHELILKHPETRSAATELYHELAELHKQFFLHRSGRAMPIDANTVCGA